MHACPTCMENMLPEASHKIGCMHNMSASNTEQSQVALYSMLPVADSSRTKSKVDTIVSKVQKSPRLCDDVEVFLNPTYASFALQLPQETSTKSHTEQSNTEPKDIGLSLGRVDPAPHTQHLQGLFAPSTQNSSLRSLSKVDSVANRQHYCRGSEELAIPETAASGLAG